MSEIIPSVKLWQLIKGQTYYSETHEVPVRVVQSPAQLLPMEKVEPGAYDVRVTIQGLKGQFTIVDNVNNLPEDQLKFYPI